MAQGIISELDLNFIDNTIGNATITAHGLLPKLNNSATSFLNGAGGWSVPASTTPLATSTVVGGIELFSDIVQSIAAATVTATLSRTYGLQINSAGQGVINIPWTDTIYSHPTGDGNLHVPATSTTNNGLSLIAGATAGALSWGNPTVADKAITLAKLADVATGTVFYRKTAGLGSPEVQTLATLKTDLNLTGTNSGDVPAAALTKTDDTNVTLTLGGAPGTALVAATSITVGWTGTLADARITSASTWNGKQGGSVSLTSLAGLNFVSTSFVKMTAAGTFALDTTVYTANTGTVTGVTATGPVLSSGGTAPIISMPAATTSAAGHLTAADWNTFNSKQAGNANLTSIAALTFTATSFLRMTAAGTFSLYIENWLLLSGGTLTGALFGTSATFSSSVTTNGDINIFKPTASLSTLNFGDGSTVRGKITMDSASGVMTIDSGYTNYGGSLSFKTDGIQRLGISSTGAATFASALTTNGNFLVDRTGGGGITINVTGAGSAELTLVSNSTGGGDAVINSVLGSGALVFKVATVERLRILSTGAATFSSSVAATAFLGNASTATNILNQGTVTLGSAVTEPNAITITQPVIAADKPVKLLTFDWYGNQWSMGNIRSSSTSSAGFGIFEGVTERFRVAPGGASTFTSSVTATAFFGPSDMRLKTLVDKVHTSSVSDIEEISYLWKDKSMGTEIQVGYDAGKVKEYMPNAVNIDDKGFMSVNYIQVLVAKVASLEKQLKQLQDAF
jgi:hypothetical protein